MAINVEIDTTQFYSQAVDSQKMLMDAEQFVILASDFASGSNAGLDTANASKVFNTTTNGAITLQAGKTYFFEACYNIVNTGTTSHTWAALFGGTATFLAASSFQAFGNSSGTANGAATGGLSGFVTGTDMTVGGSGVVVTAASTSATEQVTVELMGVLVVSAAGTVIPQMKASARPGASGTPGVTVKAGSFFRVWETGGTGAVGNWS